MLAAVPKLGPAGRLDSGTHTSVAVAKAERAIEPESIALGVFGAIAALAALLIAGQLIGRQLRLGSDERAVLRALGASPATTATRRSPRRARSGRCSARCWRVSSRWPCRRSRRSARSAASKPPSIAFDWTVLGLGLADVVVATRARRRSRSRTARHRIGSSAANGPHRAGSRAARRRRRRGPPDLGGDGHPLRARTRRRPQRGAGALRDRRRGARDGRGDFDGDVRHEPADPRVASRAVRMELELRSCSPGSPATRTCPRSR